jgi:hypothetical protein
MQLRTKPRENRPTIEVSAMKAKLRPRNQMPVIPLHNEQEYQKRYIVFEHNILALLRKKRKRKEPKVRNTRRRLDFENHAVPEKALACDTEKMFHDELDVDLIELVEPIQEDKCVQNTVSKVQNVVTETPQNLQEAKYSGDDEPLPEISTDFSTDTVHDNISKLDISTIEESNVVESPKTPFKLPQPSILSLSTRRKERLSKIANIKELLEKKLNISLPKEADFASPSPSKSVPKKETLPPNLIYFIKQLNWSGTKCMWKFTLLLTLKDVSTEWNLTDIQFGDFANAPLPNNHYRTKDTVWIGTAHDHVLFTNEEKCERSYEHNTPITRTPPMQSRREKLIFFSKPEFDFEFPIYIAHEYKDHSIRGPIELYDFLSTLKI